MNNLKLLFFVKFCWVFHFIFFQVSVIKIEVFLQEKQTPFLTKKIIEHCFFTTSWIECIFDRPIYDNLNAGESCQFATPKLYQSYMKFSPHASLVFRKNKGTSEALLNFSSKAFKALSQEQSNVGIFIDFAKAVDTINHDNLLPKLKCLYNFHQNTLDWFGIYLSMRSQFIQSECQKSASLQITCCEPRGSILCPTLFNLYINDVLAHTSYFDQSSWWH